MLDLDYPEDSGCDTDMNVVMTGKGGFVEIQGTAEGEPFGRDQMQAMLDLATRGIAQLVEAQKARARDRLTGARPRCVCPGWCWPPTTPASSRSSLR